MGLSQPLPQRVEHSDGGAVGNAGRDQVGYEEGQRRALIGIDRGRTSSRLYVDSLVWVNRAGVEQPVEEPQRSEVLERLVEVLLAIGEPCIELFSAQD